ncbi:MAG: hypothetical protein RL026_390 [Pseudomonadota bacterium]|jgi:predicted N-acyltransferase
MELRVDIAGSAAEVPADDWNRLEGTHCPFLRHEFLLALEASGCVGEGTGWTPRLLLLKDAAGLLGAVPLYRKTDSWGEFVFDQGWAQAYARHGLAYYPKLVAAVPYSPVTGSRLLVRSAADAAGVGRLLEAALRDACEAEDCSSVHVLFPQTPEQTLLADRGWLLREDCQFHWHNRGYADFEDFLATYSADKRKKARRERRRVAEAGIRFLELHGGDLDADLLEVVYQLHAANFLRHGRMPYLNRDFFARVARDLGDALMVKLAVQGEDAVAVAIFLRSADTLYGRYWGAAGEFHSLHFETCYHQGIEYCIRHGLQRFEPGTGGEHKLSRGFEPVITRSAHHVRDGRFRDAIADFVQREARHVEAYAEDAARHTPFRREMPE